MLSFPSCHGILGDIYDQPKEEKIPNTFYNQDLQKHSGNIYIDAHEYDQWIYINLEDQEITPVRLDKQTGELLQPEPENWDFAMHRYDGKTNAGAVLETTYTSLDELLYSGKLPEGNFVSDVDSRIIVDMSKMVDGIVLEVDASINEEFGKWLDVNMDQMPPIYTLSKKVYLLRTKEGKYAALYIPDFRNEFTESGYLTFEYIYPLEF